jgi:hypothetical protein
VVTFFKNYNYLYNIKRFVIWFLFILKICIIFLTNNFILLPIIYIWFLADYFIKPLLVKYFKLLVEILHVILNYNNLVVGIVATIKYHLIALCTFINLKIYNSLKIKLYNTYLIFWMLFLDNIFYFHNNRDVVYKKYKGFFLVCVFIIFVTFLSITTHSNKFNIFLIHYGYSGINIFYTNTNYDLIKQIIISALCVDNLLLISYIVFFKLGISNLILLPWKDIYFIVSVNWIGFLSEFKVYETKTPLLSILLDNIFLHYPLPNILTTTKPIFFFLGCLFFLTTLLSWAFFSYLGLNGIFKLNFITLFFFWVSLLFYIKPIFLYQKVYLIKLSS